VIPGWRPQARHRWHRAGTAPRSRRPSTPGDPTARTCLRPIPSFKSHVREAHRGAWARTRWTWAA
jgi:hypothetical protein